MEPSQPASGPWQPPPPAPSMRPPQALRPSRWQGALPGILVAVGLLAATTVIWLFLDLDGDGDSSLDEMQHGSSPFKADGDDDGLLDGWERAHGLAPDRPDTDGDGRLDQHEIQDGSDPRLADTDGDGLLDGEDGIVDCDNDGFPAAADSDDDNDGIPDGDEPLLNRCDDDRDDDGLVDGHEGNFVCLQSRDCDDDGLDDSTEFADGFDSLDPDTFDIGLSDAVAWAFAQQGQPPSPDADDDGIPDDWETSSGLISWGAFSPSVGTRDLLIEFVRIETPDSAPYGSLDFAPAYDAVAQMYEIGGDVHIQWVETTLSVPTETRPSFLDASDQDYFLGLLDDSTYGANPYVTSIILSPQQQQFELGDILGAAFLRSMIATVDYGAHTVFAFAPGPADGLVYTGTDDMLLYPVDESHIRDNRLSEIRILYGVDAGGQLPNGDLYLLDRDFDGSGEDLTIAWTPNWFQTAPNATSTDGSWLQFVHNGTFVDTQGLADTIAHELGHTLGLCHTHEAACYSTLPVNERLARDSSTMSYNAAPGTLAFLPTEWTRVQEYLQCPPAGPLTLVADGASAAAILEAKYGNSFLIDASVRECGDFVEMPRTLVFDAAPRHIEADPELQNPPAVHERFWATSLYFGLGGFLAFAGGAATWVYVAVRGLRRPRVWL